MNTDLFRQNILELIRRTSAFLPPDVYAWDNASNNRALISGKSALIMNPPSAWAVAKRDNPVANLRRPTEDAGREFDGARQMFIAAPSQLASVKGR